MKNFKVGRVYRIKYDQIGVSSEKKDPILIGLNGEEILKLALDLSKNSANNNERYKEAKKAYAPYIKLCEDLARLKQYKKENHIRKKSLIEKEAERQIKTARKKLFGKKHKYTNREQARNLFIRVLDIDRITEVNDGPQGFNVMYAGKMLTPKGNTVHKFYFIDTIKIEKKNVPDVAKKYLVISKVAF